jgi:ribosomal peptide maturation radical SAM protein 1
MAHDLAAADAGPRSAPERVQLICMPFQALHLSTLSVALLSSVLRESGIPTEECYFHFGLARLIGQEKYSRIATGPPKEGFLGELLFAESYHGEIQDDRLRSRLTDVFGTRSERARLVEEFRTFCLSWVEHAHPTLVGLTTSNYQLLPALWLAREIKKRWPDIRIVLGGAACNVPMGCRVQEGYPEVDVVVSGAGEEPLLSLATRNDQDHQRLIINEHSANLDALPIPDYGPFLRDALAFNGKREKLMLAFESSRGCWWGEKSHCTFCGLNQLEMSFNRKSSERVVREIRTLWDRYGIHLFATDTILSRSHLKEVMPALAEYPSKPKLFYEVKANMKSKEVKALRDANVVRIQPGIESLSSALLKNIRKGVTALQNLALLKWCREQNIRVSWNLLCGIPGERLEDYTQQIDLMERIPQMMPAQGVSPIRIDRYSPYFREFREFGWSELQPMSEYRSLHPHLNEEAIRDVAYYFDGQGAWSVHGYFKCLREALQRWKDRHVKGQGLFWGEEHGLIRIQDGAAFAIRSSAAVDAVLHRTHEIAEVEALCRETGCDPGLLDQLVEEGILYRERGQVINLAVRL